MELYNCFRNGWCHFLMTSLASCLARWITWDLTLSFHFEHRFWNLHTIYIIYMYTLYINIYSMYVYSSPSGQSQLPGHPQLMINTEQPAPLQCMRNILNLHNVSPLLTSRNPRGRMCSISSSLLVCCHISLSYITGFDHWNNPSKKSNHASVRIHIVIIVTVAMLTLWYFIIVTQWLCAGDFLLSCIHVNTTDLFSVTCTLVATDVILGRLECVSWTYNECHASEE